MQRKLWKEDPRGRHPWEKPGCWGHSGSVRMWKREDLTSTTVENVSGYKLTHSGIANISQIEY